MKKLSEMIEHSGLTIRQISRLFGVSVRTIYYWKKFGIPEIQLSRFQQLSEIFESIPGNPADRKMALLNSRSGRSIYQQLLNEIPKGQQLQFEHFYI